MNQQPQQRQTVGEVIQTLREHNGLLVNAMLDLAVRLGFWEARIMALPGVSLAPEGSQVRIEGAAGIVEWKLGGVPPVRTFAEEHNYVYWQRDVAVALAVELATRLGYEAGLLPATDPEPGWTSVAFINLHGVGQVSWHIADHELALFGQSIPHLPGGWDGHSVNEKHLRAMDFLGMDKETSAAMLAAALDPRRVAEQLAEAAKNPPTAVPLVETVPPVG